MKVMTCGVLIVASACVTLGYAQPSWATPSAPVSQTSQDTGSASLAALLEETRNNPENVEAWIALGQRYLDKGALEKAKESFLEAVTLDYLSAEAHFGLGLAEYARGDFSSALFEFGEVARLFPTRFDGHFNRAVTLAKLRRTEEAVSAFQEAIAQAEPEATAAAQVDAYRGLAEQLKTLERFEETAEAYTAASNLTQDSQQYRELTYLRADALYRAGQGLDALPSLGGLEGDYRVDALIADIYTQAGQDDYALRSLRRAVRNAEVAGDSDTQARLLTKLGLLQRDLGREAEAVRSFEQAVQVNADSSQALYNLGLSFLESGQPQAALAPLQRALSVEESATTYLALANTFDQLGQPDEARRNAEAAAQRLSDADLRSDANFIVGRSLYRLGDYRGALIALEDAVAQRPGNADAQLWAGLAHYQAGQYRSAAQFYERAVQLNPESVEARINLGAAYLAAERYEDAELVYELLIQQTGGDADTYYNLGWSLLSQGRGNEARQAWERSSGLGYTPARTALRQYF